MSEEPQQLVEAALAASAADGCVVLVTDHSETNLRWANNTLTTNGQMHTRSLTVISTVERSAGTGAGVVTRSVATVEEALELVAAADAAARAADPAQDAAPLVGPGPVADPGWDAAPAATDVGVFDAFARDLGAAIRDWRAQDRALFGFAEHQLSSTFLGSSTGLRRRHDQPTGRLEINGKTGDWGASAWAGVHTRDFTDVDLAGLDHELRQRLDWGRTRLEMPAGRYDTVLPPTAVADLMVYTYWNAGAREAVEGRSVFADPTGGTRVGQRLTDLPLTLRSDPHHPGLECAEIELVTASNPMQSVFDNGRPIPVTDWVDTGELAALAGTRAWSANTGVPAAPVLDNLVLRTEGAVTPVEQMIAGIERGLLLTCLWYIREVDPQTLLLTGLTRDGVFLIEDGAVAGAVNNFRFNESPVDLLGRATHVGPTVPTLSREWSDYFTRTAMPALRVPDFNMSTVSQAS